MCDGGAQRALRIGEMSARPGCVADVFHASDGNLHPLILFDGLACVLSNARTVASRILRMCIEMVAAITGEHGVGVEA
jgi:glycolate oxidase